MQAEVKVELKQEPQDSEMEMSQQIAETSAAVTDDSYEEEVDMLQHIAQLDKGVDIHGKEFDPDLDKRIAEENLRRVTSILGEKLATGCTISFDGMRAFKKPDNEADEGADSDPEIDEILALGPKNGVPNGSNVRIEREYDNLKEEKSVDSLQQYQVPANVALFPFGMVKSVVHRQITISTLVSYVAQAALNFDTVVYNHNRQPIGKIDDVFGLVENPLYVVRFASEEEAQRYQPGTELFCVHNPESYVLIHDLFKQPHRDDGFGGDESDDEKEPKKAVKRKM
ncbi:hypothetical protein QR680_004322 [Steinernema hermaphroditum]|uniref:H/ACA ribonucleoprotein complex subunit n=1 Tax=Steinernema hermaphroditum TaxID=289476 RepID=A0AA39LT03_9BILA|nr:hypothetical protein QR680_004322 [Steinernema hermaphroditum]